MLSQALTAQRSCRIQSFTISKNIAFTTNSDADKVDVSVQTSGNDVDEGTGAVATICTVTHSVSSTDTAYANADDQILSIKVINDDNADVFLWTIRPTEYKEEVVSFGDSYNLKFLPFFSLEGGIVAYGVKLETEPTAPVRVQTNITLKNGGSVLDPPVLVADPPYLVFGSSNWSTHQKINLRSISDNVDHKPATFEVLHEIITSDTVFRAKANEKTIQALVNTADDDTAGIELESDALVTLIENGDAKPITIKRFTSKPVHDVVVHVVIGTTFVYADVDEFTVPKEQWDNISKTIILTASTGVSSGVPDIRLRAVSADPKYNKSSIKAFNVDVRTLNDEPDTTITQAPAKNSASQTVVFTLYSNDSTKFEWQMDGEGYTEKDCESKYPCPVTVPGLQAYGRHRFEARAINGVSKDSTPATHEWTISHCNDLNRVPTQYAKIDKNGSLECIDCPHPVGANCGTLDGTWEDVYANKNWWTNGTRDDMYYKCPYKDSCPGGHASVGNETFKSRCKAGHTGTVCALCIKDYVFRREQCLPCEGYVPGSVTSPTPQTLTAAVLCLVAAMIFLYLYFTLPALSKEEEDDLRVKLSALDIEAIFESGRNLSMITFSDIVYRHLTDGEIAHIFQVIDTDESGCISKTELLDYITDDGDMDIDTIQDKHDDLCDKQDNTVESMETMGTALMKAKIMLSYMQCMTFLPVVFELPFPPVLETMLALLEISSLDIYVFFGELSCHMQTTFEQKFVFQRLLLPVICVCTGLVWKVVMFRKAHCKKFPALFTQESMRSRLNGFGSILSFGVYAGLSTKIFRLFKCRQIGQHFYLMADYSLMCYEGRWWNYGGVAIACILMYVVGIPVVQFIILWKHRAHLYEDSSLDDKAHRQVKKQYGSLYLHFREDCYYYELVNMFRKLMLTGGLILVGEHSTVQGLLGILVCAFWLLLVAVKFPYAVYWDNMLEIALSFGLMMTLLSGLALELFRLQEFDGNEQIVFDVLLVLMLLFGLFAGCFALATTLPFCRPYAAKLLFWNTKGTARRFLNGWVKKNLIFAKWLSVDELKGMLRSTEGTLKKMAKEKAENTHKERRLSRKIYPSRKDTVSLDIMIRTKRLVRRRTKILRVRKALLPAARKRAKPSLKSYTSMLRSHIASRRNQRKLHKEEVDRIHEDRSSKMIHLRKKQEEVLRTKEQKRLLLEKRIESRNKAKK